MYTHSSAWQDYNTPLLSQTSTMNTRLARVVSLRFHKNIIVASLPILSNLQIKSKSIEYFDGKASITLHLIKRMDEQVTTEN